MLSEAAHHAERILETIPTRDLNDQWRIEVRRWTGALHVATTGDACGRTVETTEDGVASGGLRVHYQADVLENGSNHLWGEVLVLGTEHPPGILAMTGRGGPGVVAKRATERMTTKRK